jgi:hypothetical protein
MVAAESGLARPMDGGSGSGRGVARLLLRETTSVGKTGHKGERERGAWMEEKGSLICWANKSS